MDIYLTIKTFTVTFKYDNGSDDYVVNNVSYGTLVGDIKPSNPTKTGYTFVGWDMTDETQVIDNCVITAQYKFFITFCKGVVPEIFDQIEPGNDGKLSELPSAPNLPDYLNKEYRSGGAITHKKYYYEFACYTTDDGVVVTTDTVFSGPTKVYARYKFNQSTNNEDSIWYSTLARANDNAIQADFKLYPGRWRFHLNGSSGHCNGGRVQWIQTIIEPTTVHYFLPGCTSTTIEESGSVMSTVSPLSPYATGSIKSGIEHSHGEGKYNGSKGVDFVGILASKAGSDESTSTKAAIRFKLIDRESEAEGDNNQEGLTDIVVP